jgi:hypothetical protein
MLLNFCSRRTRLWKSDAVLDERRYITLAILIMQTSCDSFSALAQKQKQKYGEIVGDLSMLPLPGVPWRQSVFFTSTAWRWMPETPWDIDPSPLRATTAMLMSSRRSCLSGNLSQWPSKIGLITTLHSVSLPKPDMSVLLDC